MIQQLGILLKNQANGRTLRLDGQVEGLSYSTVAPGGFGTTTFRVSESVANRQPITLQAMYAADLTLTDMNAVTLFEGILTDVKYHSDGGDAYYECEATGWQILLDQPYRNVVIDRQPNWQQMPIQFNVSVVRPSVFPFSVGQVVSTDSTKIGFRIDLFSGTAVTASQRNGAIVYYPPGTRLSRMKCDYDVDMNRTATMQCEIYGVNDAGGISFFGGLNPILATSLVGTGSLDIDLTSMGVSTRGILIDTVVITGGTSSAAMWSQFTNFRFLSTRTGWDGTTGSQESVAGSACVTDIIANNGQLSLDFSNVDIDQTYAVQQFSYANSATGREALDAITAYYNRYWAIWEGKRVAWKSWSPQSAADWVVSKSVAQLDLDPSIVNAANVIRVRYTDSGGLQNETDVTDANQDNIWTLAGRTKTAVVDLGVSTSTAAPQVGAVYFPDHSYEVVGGTITLDAQTPCFSQTRGTNLPAYLMRAGETVRIRDGVSDRSIFDTKSWDRATLFRITATDVDWDGQTVKLTCDNAQASLDQLTARIQTNLSAKYGT